MKFMAIGVAVATVTWMGTARARHHSVSVSVHASQGQDDRWNWQGRIARGSALEVSNVNGDVTSEPSTGSEVEVVAVKHARHGDTRDVRIHVDEQGGGARICVLYPGSDEADGCNQRGSSRRHHDDDDNDTRVDFTIRLPAGTELHAATVNGDVEVRGASAPVEGRSVNGGVDVETSAGDASAESVNGAVRAVVSGQGQAPLHFSSVNGSVDVTLPGSLNADVEASTMNGSINSDFPITISGGSMMRRQQLHGTIGQGGRRLSLSSINGGIRIRKTS